MEIFMMFGVGALVLGLIWLIVRLPATPLSVYTLKAPPMPSVKPTRVEVTGFELSMLKAETAQEARVSAGIPRSPSPAKAVDKPKAKASTSSSRSSSSSSSSSSRNDDNSYSSYSSYDGGSSYSSSCDSSSSSSSSSSCD